MTDDIYKSVLMAMNFCFAYYKIIYDESGKPADIEFVDANDSFITAFGIQDADVRGKRLCSILPEVTEGNPEFLSLADEVIKNGTSKETVLFLHHQSKWVRINVFSFKKPYFATITYFVEEIESEHNQNEAFESIMNVEKLQKIQDEFADAMGVCSIITRPDGTHITRSSGSKSFCKQLIQSTEKGSQDCICSNAMIGKLNKSGPNVSRCYSAGLWDACANITIGDRHVANWFIGQVKNEYTDDEKILSYTDRLGIDREKAAKALSEVPYIPFEKFRKLANILHICANEISETAYRNDIQSKLIGSLKTAEQRIYSENQQLKITLMSIGEAVITIKKTGDIVLMNKIAEQITGLSYEEARGSFIREAIHMINPVYEHNDDPISRILSGAVTDTIEYEATILGKDGVPREISQSISPIIGMDGELDGAVIVFRDITEAKLRQKEIVYLGYHDMLTGLYNRRYFEKKMEELSSERYLPLSIVMGDVNNLKLTNDIFGHLEGDKILRFASAVLKKACRKKDVVARWGGDEFIILMPNCSEDQVSKICEEIYQEFTINDRFKIKSSISLGYATRKNMAEDPTDVLKRAEILMYRKKSEQHEIYEKEIIGNIKKKLLQCSPVTEDQITRTKELTIKTGIFMHLPGSEIKKLTLLSDLHDIGNIAIKSEVLKKQGRLDEEEWKSIKKHPEVGYQISRVIRGLSGISDLILTRHEQWDGKGYPTGLNGEETPLLSRILAVVDSYVAMTSDRPQRSAMTKEKAIAELRRQAGKKYDANVVNVFVSKVLKST